MRSAVYAVLVAVSAALATQVACQSYTPPDEEYVFHAAFQLGEAHADIGCDACHIEAAAVMLGQQPDTPQSGWVTRLQLEAYPATCVSCHPFVRNGDAERASNCDDLDNPYYYGEYCRYQRYHGTAQGTCGDCHLLQYDRWLFQSGGDDTDQPPGVGHPPELDDVFPLIGGHADVACIDCHADLVNAANEVGKGARCTNCHTRADDAATVGGATHYPPARIGAPDAERDCEACHARSETIEGRFPDSWSTHAYNHQTHVAHNAAGRWVNGDGNIVARPETEWVTACTDCHRTPTDYSAPIDRNSCSGCHDARVIENTHYYWGPGGPAEPCISCHYTTVLWPVDEPPPP